MQFLATTANRRLRKVVPQMAHTSSGADDRARDAARQVTMLHSLVVVCSSDGGLEALSTVVASLPAIFQSRWY